MFYEKKWQMDLCNNYLFSPVPRGYLPFAQHCLQDKQNGFNEFLIAGCQSAISGSIFISRKVIGSRNLFYSTYSV